MRYYDGTDIVEDLLCLLSLPLTTRGEDVFNVVRNFFVDIELPLERICSISTDGAPAMLGKDNGFVALLKQVAPDIFSNHCLIHQTALCGKLFGDYAELMKTVMRLVNFLRSKSSLRHRQFRAFLEEVSSNFNELLLHNDDRWLRKGKVLKRLWELKEPVLDYLQSLKAKGTDEFFALAI